MLRCSAVGLDFRINNSGDLMPAGISNGVNWHIPLKKNHSFRFGSFYHIEREPSSTKDTKEIFPPFLSPLGFLCLQFQII